MNLTRAEVAAVIDYVYQHARTSYPNGKAFKVWKKMYEFLSAEEPKLFAPDAVAAEQAELYD